MTSTAEWADEKRLTPAAFHILLALTDQDRHGLGVVHEVERQTDGEVQLGPGILYGTLKRLVEWGLIEEPSERPEPDLDDPRRRYYRITKAGARAIRIEAARMERLVGVARTKRVLSSEEPT